MLQKTLKQIFGDRNSRLLSKLNKNVEAINAMESAMSKLDDNALAAKTNELRAAIRDSGSKDEVLVEAFAVVREASVRTLGLRHFDVQLLGGMVLNSGKIAEMKTGEGKTLVATLPAYLNAVAGIPVHIVTVNDYLARRDAQWMGRIFEFLGLRVGIVVSGQGPAEKKHAYQCDIVYGTNNEFGFDYLRDNMAFTADERFQNGLGFAIVDEVDSILIDEARTPLIISGPSSESTDLYRQINKITPQLKLQQSEDQPGDFTIDEKNRQVSLTEQGHELAEQLLAKNGLLPEGSTLYEISNIGLLHHLYAALRAHHLYHKNVAYIVRDGQIIIIDEFTGRMMPGRRWSDGLHQAVEAKEAVKIQQENQTLASITFQNYFRLYQNLSGMTGTADTEAAEFQQIYNLEVVIIPTNRAMQRQDFSDLVFGTEAQKMNAIIDGIKACRDRNQPVLVGTASIDSSEQLSQLLAQAKIPHEVLNAKHHDKEAQIIANAGRPGTVTIATNMAGRGTDIVLGGNLEMELATLDNPEHAEQVRNQWQQRHQQVIDAGGLHVLGSERNESRRVDNQLRGRCGRQGDPGSSRFYLSLEDNLLRIFASERVAKLMQNLGLNDGEALEHSWLSSGIQNAQMKVEGHNFDARKQLLEYDDVANEQRKVVYQQRNELMERDDVAEEIVAARDEVLSEVISRSIPPDSLEEQWDIPELTQSLEADFGLHLPIAQWLEQDSKLHEETLRQKIAAAVGEKFAEKEKQVGAEAMRHFEKAVMLRVLDEHWKEHLLQMEQLRQGIHLRGYAQKNPKQEYKREAFEMFTAMLENIKFAMISILARFQVQLEQEVAPPPVEEKPLQFVHGDSPPPPATPPPNDQPFVRKEKKIGRNQPCPCGSGKKYKQCCGKN